MHLIFFFNDTATTEIYTLSLHDALPIFWEWCGRSFPPRRGGRGCQAQDRTLEYLRDHWLCAHEFPGSEIWFAGDRKSTRLNSSHANISYAVFCLKKKLLLSLVVLFRASW